MQVEFQLKYFNQLTLMELYAILALRQEVFVVEQECAYQDVDNLDQEAWHLLAWKKESEQLVAYSRMISPGKKYKNYAAITRILTAKVARGKGIGRELVKRSLVHTEQLFGKVPTKIAAQTYLTRFYSSFGFVKIGEEYLDDGIPHIDMVLS